MSIILEQLVHGWQTVIARAIERKREKFGNQADDAMRFYASADHSFLYDQAYMENSIGLSATSLNGGKLPKVSFQATVNLTSNAVQVYLPFLYNRNPVRTVKPKQPAIDPVQLRRLFQAVGMQYQPADMTKFDADKLGRAALMQHYLNATPRELNLKEDARLSILEAFVKGMGVLWAESFPATDGTRIVGLSHDSIDFLHIDPDAETLKGAGFIVRERNEPVYKVEQKFKLPAGTLSDYANMRSLDAMSNFVDDGDMEPDATCETMRYYEVYSRIGIGSHLKNGDVDLAYGDAAREILESFGDNVYLAIPASGGYRYPLNMPPELFESLFAQGAGGSVVSDQAVEELAARLSWPIKTYCDRSNPWPCAVLGFHAVPRSPWCHSHMTPAMGIQKAIDWIMSFLIGRVQIASRAFIVVPKSLNEEIKEQILYGSDLELLEIESRHPGTQQMLAEFLKMPEVNGEIWKLLVALKQEHEDATGVTELNMAGRTTVQMRSAAEAGLKRDILSVRPDDMANAVEDWLAKAARLEAGAAATILGDEDVARVFGEPSPAQIMAATTQLTGGVVPDGVPMAGPCTTLWMSLVYGMPIDRLFTELEFSIESGSARRPNQEEQVNNVDQTAQLMFSAFLQVYGQTGVPTQLNTFLASYAKSRNMVNWQGLEFPDLSGLMAQQQAAAAMGGAPPQPGGQPQPGPTDPSQRMSIPPEMLMQMIAAAGAGAAPGGMPPPMPMTNGAH